MRHSILVEQFEHLKCVFRDGDIRDVGVPFAQAVQVMAVSELSVDRLISIERWNWSYMVLTVQEGLHKARHLASDPTV